MRVISLHLNVCKSTYLGSEEPVKISVQKSEKEFQQQIKRDGFIAHHTPSSRK